MRNITFLAKDAFVNGINFKKDNTQVVSKNGVTRMYLHGNMIANMDSGGIQITSAGWQSNTTKERLNGFTGVSIRQKKGVWYLNGNQWDGSLISV